MYNNISAAEIKYRLATEADMSLTEFARSIGRHPSTVSMVIHGKRKSKPIMEAIAAVLDTARAEQSNGKESK